MEQDKEGFELMERYLLGDLPEEQRWELASRYTADQALYEELCAAEEDLVDSYVRGELGVRDRKLFERQYLYSAPRRQKLEMARAFLALERVAPSAAGPAFQRPVPLRVVQTNEEQLRAPRSKWTLVWAAVVVLAATSVLLGITSYYFHTQTDRLRAEQSVLIAARDRADREAQESRQENARLKSERNTPAQPDAATGAGNATQREREDVPIVAYLLVPRSTRQLSSSRSLVLAPPVKVIKLQALLPPKANFAAYQFQIQTPSGSEVWAGNKLGTQRQASGTSVFAELRAEQLPLQDYVVILKGCSTSGECAIVAEYALHIVRKRSGA